MYPSFPSALVVCEVCETAQAPATLCANCDMPLKLPKGVRPVADPPIERVPGLEPNAFDDVQVYAAPIPDLELTHHDAAPEGVRTFVPGFEPTADLLLDLPGEDPVLAGLERTVEEFVPETSGAAYAPDACPYCGHVQPGARICDNCGRQRSRVLGRAARRDVAGEPVRCHACGARVEPAELCSDCGQPLPVRSA